MSALPTLVVWPLELAQLTIESEPSSGERLGKVLAIVIIVVLAICLLHWLFTDDDEDDDDEVAS